MGEEVTFRRKGDKNRYSFSDARCIGRFCWAAGMFQHRSPLSGGGSRNTGSPDSPCCLNRAYRGCPEGPEGARDEFDANLNQQVHICGLPVFQPELAKQRKAEGWKKA